MQRRLGHAHSQKPGGFEDLHRPLLRRAFEASPREEVTLGQDATFIETETRGPLYNYQGKRSYEALSVSCLEYGLEGAEFRDGNANPGYGQLGRFFENLPCGIFSFALLLPFLWIGVCLPDWTFRIFRIRGRRG